MADEKEVTFEDVERSIGLGGKPESEWPRVPANFKGRPIDRLAPGSETHKRVLSYLIDRLDYSERAMAVFHPRWRHRERQVQAYIDHDGYEKMLKEFNKTGKPPSPISITVPYSFATLSTIVTYLIHTFGGRRPMFPVGTYKEESVEAAGMMELVLQYYCDHERLIKHLFQTLNDGELYGLQVMVARWKRETALRTVWRDVPQMGMFGVDIGSTKQRFRERKLVYEGSEMFAVEPFMFFPDPRVPMSEVSRRGEFVFWRSFDGRHTVRQMEAEGVFQWTKEVGELPRDSTPAGEGSNRHLISNGESHPGLDYSGSLNLPRSYVQIDQGSVEIIPRELGLGESDVPEKWMFALGNKRQIMQAEPFDHDHNKHPVAVGEPYTLGYGFGNPGLSDYLGPVQDTVSWFINSHIHNVRASLNNMFIYDPSKIEEQDLKKPGPGGRIRIKRSAYGQDIRTMIQQFDVQDVTRGHMQDMEVFIRIGDVLSAVNDNIRGQQDSGGRKTATEVRTSAEAAASRLAAHAKLISSQFITDITEMMVMDTQQFLSEEFYIQIVGQEGRETPLRITPDQLVGDFYFPVHDGTLPLDKVALLDIWREIFQAIQSDQELRQTYSMPKIFEFMAELGGAKNIENFRINIQPEAELQQMAQAGNVVPMTPGSIPGSQMGGPGTVPAPGRRMLGGFGV